MARTFQFEDAPAALAMLTSPHSPGKIALTNNHQSANRQPSGPAAIKA
jgi:hypothetical protein